MLNVLLTGALVGDPRERTAKTGRLFLTAQVRVPTDQGESILASLVVFSDTVRDALLPLRKGDAISAVGRASLSTWESNGEAKHGISVVAEAILTAHQVDKRRSGAGKPDEVAASAPVPARPAVPAAAEVRASGGVADLDEDIPF